MQGRKILTEESHYYICFLLFLHRLLKDNTVEETFVKPSSTNRVMKKTHSLESSQSSTAVRSSPRRRQQLSKIASIPNAENRRRASTSSLSSSSKVTMTTLDAAGRKRSSRSSSSSSTGGRSGGSRKQKHIDVSIVCNLWIWVLGILSIFLSSC